MQQTSLSRLAGCSQAEFQYLKTQIDQASLDGHTYEFQNCLLLAGCTPVVGTVGFWHDRSGYVLYLSPKVSYTGSNRSAAGLFRTSRQGFGTFEELSQFLRGLNGIADPIYPFAPDLTDADQVVLPDQNPAAPADYTQLAQELSKSVIGQEAAVEAVAFALFTHIYKKAPVRPLSLIFHGPTGVGKSELGKHIAAALNHFCGDDAYHFVWTELNTFTQAHSVYRLLGAPPGYVGYDDKPVFEAAADHPYTVFMFDELEKAHPAVLKTFMSILDEGRCAARKELPNHSRELDFRHCIFIFTTNANLSSGRAPAPDLPSPDTDPVSLANRIFMANEQGRRALAGSGVLREIAGRFSGYVEFTPLSSRAKVTIIARQVVGLAGEYGLELNYVSPAIIQAILNQAADGGAFSVRSHTGIIEGYLTPFFLTQAERYPNQRLRLEGTVSSPRLVPVQEACPACACPAR